MNKDQFGKIFSKKRHYNIHRGSHKPNQTLILRQTAVPDEGILHFVPSHLMNKGKLERNDKIQKYSDELLQRVNKKLKALGKQPLEKIQQEVIMHDEGVGTFDLCSVGVLYMLNIEGIVRESELAF